MAAEAGTRERILAFVKMRDGAGVHEVARHFRVTHEGARRQLVRMERDGWLNRRPAARPEAGGAGRPRDAYVVSPAGDHRLPKAYGRLALAVLDGLRGGPAALRDVLAGLARAQAEAWAPRLQGLDLRARLEALRGIYAEEDPFVTLELGEREARLAERNCPFLGVALAHPMLCSLTVNTLETLLERPVAREETFQAGHGRCVFRVSLARELPRRAFLTEEERAGDERGAAA